MLKFQIEKTPIWLDIKPILDKKNNTVKFEYRGMLHTEIDDIPIIKIVSIDTVRDYAKAIGDYIHIEFIMALGDYATKLYPYRNNLEFSIKTITLLEVEVKKNPNVDDVIDRYKAIFLPDANKTISANELEQFDAESLNNSDIITVKLQLMDRSLEPLRIKMVSGVFRQVTQKTLLQNLMTGESNKILVDGNSCIDGVNIVEPDNKEIRKNQIIQEGTLLTELPSFIQNKLGGVYASGIGNYLQIYNSKKLWFVYPLFDPSQFDKPMDKCIIYAVPENRFPELDRTYLKEGSVLKIIASGEKDYKDQAETELMDKGSGFRMANAGSFMKKPISLQDDKVQTNRAALNYEMIAMDRKDGLNFAPVSKHISSNPFNEYSKLIHRDTAMINLVWDYANPKLLYPNIPCKYIYLIQDQVVELKGNIIYCHVYTNLEGHGLTSTLYRVRCQLVLKVEKASVSQAASTLKKTNGVF